MPKKKDLIFNKRCQTKNPSSKYHQNKVDAIIDLENQKVEEVENPHGSKFNDDEDTRGDVHTTVKLNEETHDHSHTHTRSDLAVEDTRR